MQAFCNRKYESAFKRNEPFHGLSETPLEKEGVSDLEKINLKLICAWAHHGQIDFFCPAADGIQHPTADVQCR